jgi:DNA repair exonuclease SbcCD nuclease subunit
MTKLLVIGDVHIKLDNFNEIQTLIQKLISTIQSHTPDYVILLGDVLHTHERVHTHCLNQAAELFKTCSELCPTYVLVGNHDYISNSQFLTDHHWMNPFKRWSNLTIVDKVTVIEHDSNRFTLAPYVPDGRFVEALQTDPDWMNSGMIFGHQSLDGVKMGMVLVSGVEDWKEEYPFLCSGHIHDKQRIKPNLYYTGTPMPHAFGERNDKTVSIFTVDNNKIQSHEELNLRICEKRIEYLSIDEATHYEIKECPNQHIRLTIKATPEESRAFKRTVKYKTWIEKGIKVVFDDHHINQKEAKERKVATFDELLFESIKGDMNLRHWYRKYIGMTEHDTTIELEE